MLNLTIDNINVQVEPGATVLDAALKAGINIPTLCHHPKLHPYGACRLCLVEVKGARTLMPSCTMPAADNMVIETNNERVKAARKFVLSMLFSERNHFCMYCQATDGDCELQNSAYEQDMTHWPITPAYQPFAVDASHPDFILDNNRCILCRRCVRTCSELVGNSTLGFEERGSANFLVADNGVPLGESTCISCGNCVQFCPTGAFIDRRSIYQGRETDLTHTKSVCVECSVGCDRVILTRDNRLVRLESDEESCFNEGLLCELGRYLPMDEKRERIGFPMLRRDGTLTPTTWDQALAVIATQLKANDSDEIMALISPRQTMESLIAFNEFFKDYFQVDHITQMTADQTAVTCQKLSAELGSFESDINSLKDADATFVFGADLMRNHQVAGFFLRRQQYDGQKVFFAGKNPGRFADNALDSLVYTGEDFKSVIAALTAHEDAERESLCQQIGLDAEAVKAFTADAPNWQKPVIVIGREVANSRNLDVLRKLLYFAKSINAKVVALKGKANTLTASLLGMKPYDQAETAKVAFIAMGDGKACQEAQALVRSVGFKIVLSAYENELTEQADIVLPATMWAEESGHYLSSDGCVKESKQSLEPSENAKTTAEVMFHLADRIGFKLNKSLEIITNKKETSIAIKPAVAVAQ